MHSLFSYTCGIAIGITHVSVRCACAILGNTTNVSNMYACVIWDKKKTVHIGRPCVIGIPIAHTYEMGHVGDSRDTAHILYF